MFFPGEDGYCINIPKSDANTKALISKTVSAAEFYSYRLMERRGESIYVMLFLVDVLSFMVAVFSWCNPTVNPATINNTR